MAAATFDRFLEEGLKDWSIIRRELLEDGDRRYIELDISGFELEHEPRLREVAAFMTSLGMTGLGDLMCTGMSNVVVRGFAEADGPAYGTIMIPSYGDPVVEFYSSFRDGCSITTTTVVGPEALPAGKIRYQRCGAGTPPEALWATHQAAITAQAPRGNDVAPVRATLTGFAETIEEFLKRQLGALFSAS
jgi:hypothetical protein